MLAGEKDDFQRKIKESTFIAKCKPALNVSKGMNLIANELII